MTLKQLRSVTVSEGSEKLNVSGDFIRRLCKSGKVRFFREGPEGTFHVIESDLIARVEELLEGAAPLRSDPEEDTPLSANDPTIPRPRRDIEDLLPPRSERRFSGRN